MSGPLHHRRGHAALPRRHDRGKPPCRPSRPLTVKNDYFGGNVNVTGLLTAQDIAPAIKAASEREELNHG
ncbi:MAG: DUF512 domain-containing protein [Adlercreutzia equolifaciens]